MGSRPKSANFALDGPVSQLVELSQQSPAAFVQLAIAVGAGWGQAGADRTKTASTLIELCARKDPPKWSLKRLGPDGISSRTKYAQRFLAYINEHHVRISDLRWDAR
jgi:hypothetical protein